MGRPGTVRQLPLPFTHYFTVASDCDSSTLQTALRIRRALASDFGLELSDSFFPNADWEPSLSPLLDLQPRSPELLQHFDSWFDHAHGLINQVSLVEWPTLVAGRRPPATHGYPALRQVGYQGVPARKIHLEVSVPAEVTELSLSFSDDKGREHFIVVRGELDGRPGWQLEAAPGRHRYELSVAEERNATGSFSLPASIRLHNEPRRSRAIVVSKLLFTNADRGVFDATFDRLSELGIRVTAMTAHEQPDHVSAIGGAWTVLACLRHARRAGTPAPLAIGATRLVRQSLSAVAHGWAGAHQTVAASARHSGWRGAVHSLQRVWAPPHSGDHPRSVFFAAADLHRRGVRFLRLYRETALPWSLPMSSLISPTTIAGSPFYCFPGFLPPGRTRATTNDQLFDSLARALDYLEQRPAMHGAALYTHWGCYENGPPEHGPFNRPTRLALQRLSDSAHGRQRWLWTRPLSKLLRHSLLLRGLQSNIRWHTVDDSISIRSWVDPVTNERLSPATLGDELEAFPIEVPDGSSPIVRWDGEPMETEAHRHGGRSYVSLA